MRTRLLVAGLGATLTACVAPPLATTAPDGEADVEVVATDMRFTPDAIEVVSRQPTVLRFENAGGTVHDLVMDNGWASGEVKPGQTVDVILDPLANPTIAWCSIPGHRDAGMELAIEIVDG